VCKFPAVDDGSVTQSIIHYRASGGVGSYENTTFSSSTDFSPTVTQVVADSDGGLRLFYRSSRAIGFLTLTEDGKISEGTVAKDPETYFRWDRGISVVSRQDGSTVVSNPLASVGYLTDSFTFSERFFAATAPLHQVLIVLAAIIVVIGVSLILSRRSFINESKWHKSLEE
jgi:hypothetical protein